MTEQIKKVTAKDILERVNKERNAKKLAKEERQKAHKFYARLWTALAKTKTRVIVDPNTKRWIGMKFKYGEVDGQSIYDMVCYNNDPFEQKLLENIEVIFDPNDQKDGSWVSKPIDIKWLNKNY